MDLETVDELLTTTRAVRKRLDPTRPVPAEVITECVRLATQAPTAGDAQSWRWLAVTDPRIRAAIADIYRADNEPYVRGALADAEGPARTRLESVLHLFEAVPGVPVHVLAYVLEDDALPPAVMYGASPPLRNFVFGCVPANGAVSGVDCG